MDLSNQIERGYTKTNSEDIQIVLEKNYPIKNLYVRDEDQKHANRS